MLSLNMRMISIFLLFMTVAGFAIDQKDYIPGQLIVKFRPTSGMSSQGKITALAAVSQKYGVSVMQPVFTTATSPADERDNFFLLNFSEATDVAELAAKMSAENDIEYAQPNYLHRLSAVPNDPLLSRQDYLEQIEAFAAWDYSQGSEDVIIAIIDTGVDYIHEDLTGNIWRNREEVLDGIDNDGNLYVDDIRGWDFVRNVSDAAPGEDAKDPDNDPMDFQGHGTNVAGFASASANNAIGIAGLGWSCKIMPLRAGYKGSDGNGYLPTISVIEAIYYAADNGADIINASFGSIWDDYAERDAFLYAYTRGVLIVKAAGNDNSDIPHSPGREDWILSVAAVNSSDRKCSFSNFGPWVKVSAPGSSIYTTSRNNRYGSTSGTSFAAPIVAGVAGLLKAAHPDWSPAQILMHIVDTADPVDVVNAGYECTLGKRGRVNARAALQLPFASEPEFLITRVNVEDLLNGNGDQRMNIGETCDLLLRITNRWNDATNVTATISSDDPSIKILKNSAFFAAIPGISSLQNYVENVNQYFTIKVSDNAFPHNVKFQMNLSADGASQQTVEFQVAIESRVLFVDDDDGQLNVEDYYFSALDSLGMPYDIWDRSTQGHLGSRLRNYDIVIWSCESAFPTLEETDRDDLQSYLRYFKNLFIAGQNIAWDLAAPQSAEDAQNRNYYNQRNQSNGKSQIFYENYLQAEFLNDASSYSKVIGVSTDPIGKGLEFPVFEPKRNAEEQSRDVIDKTSNSTPVFTYPDGQIAAVRSERLGKVVHFAFGGFEAIAEEGARLTVMQRILGYFTGFMLEVKDLVYVADQVDDFVVDATVAGEKPVAVHLYWRTIDQSDYTIVAMTAVDDTLYQGTIPLPAYGSVLEYGVQAVAESGLYSPIKIKQLEIKKAAPIVYAALEKRASLTRRPCISMRVSHISSLDTTSAKVLFWTTNAAVDSVFLLPLGDNRFGGEIQGDFSLGDTLYYQFVISDETDPPVRGASPVYQMILSYEDFESGLDDWETQEGGWGLDDFRKRSGVYSLSESPNGDYPPNANLTATLKKGINLSDVSQATLVLWMMYAFQPGDVGYIEASNDAGATWRQLDLPVSGAIGTFEEARYSLNEFTGPGNENVLLRFRFTSDAANSGPGWFIDDISIVPLYSKVQTAGESIPGEFVLYKNYPNPFNTNTIIRYALPQNADVQLFVYNTLGQKVTTLVNEQMDAGIHTVTWHGVDSDGNVLPSGLYFYQLKAGDYSAVDKLMMIK
ncbi:T9SS C-terminal target domain-containing protein [candidate division KSB1 bacterium]|nr:S8 family serine peptidase [candidate division KSB1 bacterium]RQW00119.1 MAG: T9SS C-terminal target domain-containing protein [candidate division KSB1 bacterium]